MTFAYEMKVAMNAETSRIEHAIALAAWTTVHWLRPVPFEDDAIAKAIAWRKDADFIDTVADVAMPSEPRSHSDCCPEIIEAAGDILPLGDAKPLGRYHFFESMTDPSLTDYTRVINSIDNALIQRAIPGIEDRAVAIGQFVLGPLGVLESPSLVGVMARSEWGGESPTALPGSLASYVQTIGDYRGSEVYVEGVHDQRPKGWSPAWCDWYDKRGPINREPNNIQMPDETKPYIKVALRQDWGPPRSWRQAMTDQAHGLLEEWPDAAFRKVLKRKRTVLSRILARCLKHDRKPFFEGLRGSRDREARRILAGPLDDVPLGVIRQLLLLAAPETVVSAAMELRAGPFSPAWGTFSFAEYLASALLRSYSLAECEALLAGFMARAGGSDWDRVLHYIVKQEPSAVLRSHLSANPLLASALARVTCAPLRFHSPAGWDPGDPEDVNRLCEHAGRVLGEEVPPSPPGRAMPFMPPPMSMLTDQQAFDFINRGRRRPEYLTKIAIQYIYVLQSHVRSPWESDWRRGRFEIASPRFFWQDDKFVKEIAARTKARNGEALIIPDNAAMVLSDLLAVLDAAGKLVAKDAPLFLKAVRDAQRVFRRAIEEWGVFKHGNLGSHDNVAGRRKLQEALDSLRHNDASVRAIDDALPSFVMFKQMVRKPNRPSVVRVEAYEPMRMMHAGAKCEHHITNPNVDFRGDRVYSFTDVTRNQVSVNPIVLDWSDWLAWSQIASDSDKKVVKRRSL